MMIWIDYLFILGVAKAIARAAGEELVRESEDTIRRLGKPLDTGETCTTSAGNLPCRVVNLSIPWKLIRVC